MFRTTSASIGMTQLRHYPYIKFRFSNYLCIILCFFFNLKFCLNTGMGSDNCRVDGQMGHHISHSALFKLTRVMCTTSPSLAKGELSSGMLTSHG